MKTANGQLGFLLHSNTSASQDEKIRVLAVAAHPDDIEFMMAGTFLLLGDAGAQLHYLTLSNGDLGSTRYDREKTAFIRRYEAKQAAALASAQFHESFCTDLNIDYDQKTIAKLSAVVRQVDPTIVLIPSLSDYMEDHMQTARVALTAVFAKGIPSYQSDPPQPSVSRPVALYHALPHGLLDGLKQRVVPDFCVDISSVIERKVSMLKCHESQGEWLDATQNISSYVQGLYDFATEIGSLYGNCRFAEGWIRHNPLGYSPKDFDPLRTILQPFIRGVSR